MKKLSIFSLLFLIFCLQLVTKGQQNPFPQNIKYKGLIRPAITEQKMNQQIVSYYKYWKEKYVKPSAKTPGALYISGENTGGTAQDKGTSEGQGYGMIISVLMAGSDTSAKTQFDGLYKMYDTHRSNINSDFMGWLIDAEETPSGKHSSATDGDLDIAYALLLAHAQWGSEGKINYKKEGLRMIAALRKSIINYSDRTALGDWDDNAYNSRPSDWHFDHFKSFYDFTNDKKWIIVYNNLYQTLLSFQKDYSPQTGLIPDFIVGKQAVAASPNFLEGPNDGFYYYNACRVPLRVVIDYAHHQNDSAKVVLKPIVNWFVTTFGTPHSITSGFTLDGKNLEGNNYQDAVFIAPIVAAACIDESYQDFVDQGWNYLVANKVNYFSDTYNLLTLLHISGNWWKPLNK